MIAVSALALINPDLLERDQSLRRAHNVSVPTLTTNSPVSRALTLATEDNYSTSKRVVESAIERFRRAIPPALAELGRA